MARPCHASSVPGDRRRRLAEKVRRRGLLGPDTAGVLQSLVALAISSITSTAAGVALASVTGTLEELPGLLVLVPAAIGMRGNIFGALGSRLSTAIHTGLFVVSRRPDGIVGQNVSAAIVSSLLTSAMLAPAAKLVATAFGVGATISVADLLVVSVVGGLLGSLVVMLVALALAAMSANRGWDLDNVNAPIVSAVGDLVTLPALVLGTVLVQRGTTTNLIAVAAVAVSLGLVVVVVRSGWRIATGILRESLPVLTVAGIVLAVAGVVIERQFDAFSGEPALLILVPAALSSAGAIGGILSSQLASKLHLGIIEPGIVPDASAWTDLRVALIIAAPIFVLNGLLAAVGAQVFDLASPGSGVLVLVSLSGGMASAVVVAAIAYYGTIAAVRLGVDPDNYGIPIVTSVVDLVGAWALVAAVLVFT